MVNFYDNYQQSKVMNLIPSSAKDLLKANKDQIDLDSKYHSIISDMADKANANFISSQDAKEFSERSSGYIDAAKAIAADRSLDADPVSKFRAIAKIHGEMLSDKRLGVLIEGNKNMAGELKKMAPSLQGYFDRSVRPYLRSPEDGSVWSMNYDFNPERDFESIMSEAKNVLKPTIVNGSDNKPLKYPGGEYVTELSEEAIDNWIDENSDRLMATRPGAVYSVVDNIERNIAATSPDSELTRVDLNDPIHSNVVKDEFKNTLKRMFSEYSRQSVQRSGKGINIKIDNAPKLTDPIVPIDVLYKELSDRGLFDKPAYRLGAAPGSKSKYDLSDLASRIKYNSKGFLESDVVPTSSTDFSDFIWKQGSNIGVIATQNQEQNTVIMEGMSSFRNSKNFGVKNYNVFPSLSSDAHIVSYKKGPRDGMVDKRVGSGWAGNNIGNGLKQLADSKLLSLYETTSVTPDFIVLPNGEVGSIATIKIPEKGNNDIGSPLEYLFGEQGTLAKKAFARNGDGSTFTMRIKGGMDIVIKSIDFTSDKAPDGKAGTYFVFDVAKPIGRMSGASTTTMLYDTKISNTGLTNRGAVTANSGLPGNKPGLK